MFGLISVYLSLRYCFYSVLVTGIIKVVYSGMSGWCDAVHSWNSRPWSCFPLRTSQLWHLKMHSTVMKHLLLSCWLMLQTCFGVSSGDICEGTATGLNGHIGGRAFFTPAGSFFFWTGGTNNTTASLFVTVYFNSQVIFSLTAACLYLSHNGGLLCQKSSTVLILTHCIIK